MWALERGATVLEGGAVRFALWAPHAERVSVVVASGAGAGVHALEPHEGGVFAGVVERVRPGDDYVYRLAGAGTVERADPVSRFQPAGVQGPSRVVDPRAFASSDPGR